MQRQSLGHIDCITIQNSSMRVKKRAIIHILVSQQNYTYQKHAHRTAHLSFAFFDGGFLAGWLHGTHDKSTHYYTLLLHTHTHLRGRTKVRREVLPDLGRVGERHAELKEGKVVLSVHLLELLAGPARHGGGHAGPCTKNQRHPCNTDTATTITVAMMT